MHNPGKQLPGPSRHRALTGGVAALGFVFAAGCGANGNDDEIPTDDGGEQAEPDEPTDEGPTPDVDPQAEAAIDDLAEREGTDPGDIEPGDIEPVTWSDGSIGCPEPGEAYTQALVEGYRLVLVLQGEEYHYHAAEDGEFFYCEEPADPIPSPEG